MPRRAQRPPLTPPSIVSYSTLQITLLFIVGIVAQGLGI